MTLYVLRWLIYPQEAKQIFSHPAMALFLGAIPMGLATILNGFLKYGVAIYGKPQSKSHNCYGLLMSFWR